MADNSSRLDASGISEQVASDDIGGAKYQRVKMNIGPDGTSVDVLIPADAMTAANAGIVPAAPELFNETTFDRQRGNTQGTLLASASRTTGTNSADQTNYNARGVWVFLNVTVAGTGTLVINLYAREPISGNAVLIAGGPNVSTSAQLILYPGISDADLSGDARQGVLPRTWLAQVNKSDGSSWTYSLSYALVL